MNSKFPHLFSPLKVGIHTYRNRIEAAPAIFAFVHMIDCTPLFKPRNQLRALRMLENKAKGGCASVVLGELGPNHDDCKRFPFEPAINWKDFNDPFMPVFRENAEAIKKHGAIAIAELVGVGNSKPLLGDGIEPLGPVEFTRPDGVRVKAFDQQSIKKLRDDHVNACLWLREAGWQGIMIHAGHGWLPAQFLSPLENTRTDEYGGSLENRARFALEILQDVREAMGKEFIIELRVSGTDHIPGSICVEETAAFCKMAEPYIDLVHVSTGHYWKPGRSFEFTTAWAPHGLNLEDAARIKQELSIPVAVVGGINSPEFAEAAIAAGKVDIIALGRQLFSDPDFANKAMNGEEDTIRRCIRCAKCYPGPAGEHPTERPAPPLPPLGSCSINPNIVWPASHHEILPEDMPKPTASRKVLVVGGGCAGMQAAITAAERGHQVILAEKTGKLGGLLNFTDTSAHKEDIRNFKELLIREVKKAGVDIRLNCEVTGETIFETKPDAVILAVGSKELMPPIPGIENAIPALDTYFKDFGALGKSTIVLGGGLVGCESALEYAEKGIQVTIIEKVECLIPEMFGIYRTAVHDKIDEYGVKYVVNATAVEIGKDYVRVRYPDGQEEKLTADSVVSALGRVECTEIVEDLKKSAQGVKTYEAGDCVKAARIGDALDAAWTAVMQIL